MRITVKPNDKDYTPPEHRRNVKIYLDGEVVKTKGACDELFFIKQLRALVAKLSQA